MYTFSSYRQAHQHRRLWVNFVSLYQNSCPLCRLCSRQQAPCRTVRQLQAREEHGARRGDGRPGSAVSWGQRDRNREKEGVRRGALLTEG